MARGFLTVVALVGTALRASVALADEPDEGRVQLQWVRGADAGSCPAATDVARGVTARLGHDPFDARASRWIECSVVHEGTRWTATLFVRDEHGDTVGTRTLTSDADSCAPVAAASTLAIALAIDPDAALRPAPPSPVTTIAPVVVPPAAPPPVRIRRRARALPPAGTHGSVAALAVGGLGLLPALAPGLAVDAAVGPVPLLALHAGLWFVPEQRTAPGAPSFGFGLTTARVAACVVPLHTTRIELEACGAGWLGALYAVTFDTLPDAPGGQIWGALSLAARVGVRVVGPVQLVASVDGLATVTRWRFVSASTGHTEFQPPAVALIGALGLAVSFP